jgi:hypothetical protein
MDPSYSHASYASVVKLGFQFSKPPPSSDASWLGCAARFDLSAMSLPPSMNGLRFQAPPVVGQLLSSARTADLSKDRGIFDSNGDDDLSSVKQILASSRRAKRRLISPATIPMIEKVTAVILPS